MWNPVAEQNLPTLLRVIGAATMGAALVFVAPNLVLGMIGIAIADDTSLFFVRHWGLLVGCLGGLLFYSAAHRALQIPAMVVVTIEKLAIVVMAAMNASNPALAGMLPAAGFDAVCVLLFGVVLWRHVRRSPAIA